MMNTGNHQTDRSLIVIIVKYLLVIMRVQGSCIFTAYKRFYEHKESQTINLNIQRLTTKRFVIIYMFSVRFISNDKV